MTKLAAGITAIAIMGLASLSLNADPTAPVGFEPSKVTISVKDAKLADVLKALADQSRNALLAAPEKWAEKPVTVDVKDATFFEALDAICASAGLRYDAKGLTVEPALRQKDIGEYLGPAVVKAARLTKTHAFRDASYPQSLSLQIEFTLFWESRLAAAMDSCEITKVTTADGRELQMHRRRGPAARSFSMPPYSVESAPLASRVAFTLLDSVPAKIAGGTLNVEGTAELGIGTGEKVLSIPKVLAAEGVTVTEGDISLTVKKVQRMGPGAVFYGMLPPKTKDPLSFMVGLKKDSKDPLVLGGGGAPYGIFVVDPRGKRYPAGVNMGSQTFKDDAWTAEIYPAFDKPEGMDDTWSLAYVYPEKIEMKQWTFTVKDVPLP